MKKLIYFALIASLSAGMSSCKGFLDQIPRNALTDANAITDLSKAQAAVGGVYATFQNDDWAGSLYVSQASKAGFVRWSVSDYDMSYTQTSRGAAPWTTFYRSLNAANFAIQGIEKLSSDAISDADRTRLIAEARCLRAWIHANIFWNYAHWWSNDDSNPYGLIYRDAVIDLNNIEMGRISVGESYEKIFEDIDYAIANLGDFTTPRYVSKQFAKVLKAKLLLYRGGYNNNQSELNAALSLVNDVLSNHPASFQMGAHLWDDVYALAWDSKENLFVRYLEDDGTRTSKGGYYYTYYLSQIAGTPVQQGTDIPLAVGGTVTAGLNFGLDWFKADPRWYVVTGDVRAGETWDETYRWTFKKVARKGSYAGKLAPVDEKYAAYYFRYPELYIMKAELLARTNSPIATAIAPINEMRSKRTYPVLPALNPGTQQELMDLIFKEYFLETFLENGSEFFAALRFRSEDGKRWIETIKGRNLEENTICWPIPDAEMINNPAVAGMQNPDLN